MVKNLVILVGLGIIFLSLLNLVSATLVVNIDVKPSFVVGEEMKFNYYISSDIGQEIQYVRDIVCPNAPRAPLFVFSNLIDSVNPINGTFVSSIVTEDLEPQVCTAYIKIKSSINQTFEKNFTIATNPSFIFNLILCKDLFCVDQSKVFSKNTNVYFNYSSDVSNLIVNGILTSPDGNIKDISIPSNIQVDQVGTYTLNILASKQGYKNFTSTQQFGVIERPAKIKTVVTEEISKYNVTNMVSITVNKNVENVSNLPSENISLTSSDIIFYTAGAMIILAIIIAFVIYLLLRKK